MTQPTRVLIVEDDRFNVRLLTDVCRNAGFESEVVMDGLAALDAVTRNRPDLILLDLMIPQLDGYGVLERLRAQAETADLPVILVTAVQDREARARAIDLGVDDFVAKPFKLLELQQRIQAALQMRAFKRQLTRDLTPPAGRPRPRVLQDEAPAVDAAVTALRVAASPVQVITVEFSPEGPAEVVEAVLSAAREQVPGGKSHVFLRAPRRHTLVVAQDALTARRLAAALHTTGQAQRQSQGTTQPRIWWGVGADRESADAACAAARESDAEPQPLG